MNLKEDIREVSYGHLAGTLTSCLKDVDAIVKNTDSRSVTYLAESVRQTINTILSELESAKTKKQSTCKCEGWGCWGCCSSEDEIRAMQGAFS